MKILFEDSALVVAEKPANLLTIATAQEKRRTLYALLFERLAAKRPPERLFIVHRLDRDASGILVFAKCESVKRNLQAQFHEHSAGRLYQAVVENRIDRDTYTIQSFLAENAAYHSYSTRDRTKGQWAVTHVSVLKRGAHRTLVDVRLETGRKHQIRVHLAEQGHPIVGDETYGSRTNPIRRMALHARKLTFKHPFTGKVMEFLSPPPREFVALV